MRASQGMGGSMGRHFNDMGDMGGKMGQSMRGSMGGSIGGSMGRSSMDMKRSMIGSGSMMNDQKGMAPSNNLDDMSNPFGANFNSRMSSNQKMNSDTDFRSGFVIGGGRGGFDEDSFGGGNAGRSSMNVGGFDEDSFGGGNAG